MDASRQIRGRTRINPPPFPLRLSYLCYLIPAILFLLSYPPAILSPCYISPAIFPLPESRLKNRPLSILKDNRRSPRKTRKNPPRGKAAVPSRTFHNENMRRQKYLTAPQLASALNFFPSVTFLAFALKLFPKNASRYST